MNYTYFCICRDFYLVSNQFKLWMLTTDIAYLRDSAVKGFETIVQRNKNFLQVRFTSVKLKNSVHVFLLSGNV